MRKPFPAIIVRAYGLAMSFGKGWSLKNYENNKPW
jgi:hypothetical protein